MSSPPSGMPQGQPGSAPPSGMPQGQPGLAPAGPRPAPQPFLSQPPPPPPAANTPARALVVTLSQHLVQNLWLNTIFFYRHVIPMMWW